MIPGQKERPRGLPPPSQEQCYHPTGREDGGGGLWLIGPRRPSHNHKAGSSAKPLHIHKAKGRLLSEGG